MANTYTQIHIHAVFAVQNRASLIQKHWKHELYKYITGIITHQGHKMLAINGMPDHVHVLFGHRPQQSLSDLMQDVKGSSSKWINERRLTRGHFSWQEGYGAFACSKDHMKNACIYIENQETHHRQKSFLTEYKEFLIENEVSFDERYIFTPVEYDPLLEV